MTRQVKFERVAQDVRKGRRVFVGKLAVGYVTESSSGSGWNEKRSFNFQPTETGERLGMKSVLFDKQSDFRRAVQPGSVTNLAQSLFRK